MRLDDPSDNGGRGWRRLASDEVADLAYIAIRLASRGVRIELASRDAAKADKAARKLAEAVSRRFAAISDLRPCQALQQPFCALSEGTRKRRLDQSGEQDDKCCCGGD
jgi:hypothetical protein